MTILNILMLVTICVFGKSKNAMILKMIKMFDEDEIKEINEDEENKKAMEVVEQKKPAPKFVNVPVPSKQPRRVVDPDAFIGLKATPVNARELSRPRAPTQVEDTAVKGELRLVDDNLEKQNSPGNMLQL